MWGVVFCNGTSCYYSPPWLSGLLGLVNLMVDLYLHVSVESGDTRFSPQINQADICSVPLGFLQLVLSLLKSMAQHHQTLVGYESGAAQPVAGLDVPRRWHTDCPDRLLGRRQAVSYNRSSATLLNTFDWYTGWPPREQCCWGVCAASSLNCLQDLLVTLSSLADRFYCILS